ncbi:methyl-accepting chemotaxis protein [Sphingomonas sp. Leaf37]|uniref:methyl-accepting chemotaxis protein n=1 Tax=Sphingomonas sp. Leaf37 TaxID=2876552 RepID=UPI0022A71F8E|nr:methyl-accepting chemotaxis protein [Sphingomonas sp. Leaf37]
MKNLSLLSKLLLAFGCCMAIMLGLSGIAVNKLSVMNDSIAAFADNRLPKAKALGQLEASFNSYRTAMYRHIASATPAAISEADRKVIDTRGAVTKAATDLQGLVSAPDARQATARIQRILPEIFRRDEAVLTLSRSNQNEAATAALLAIRGQSERLMREVGDLNTLFVEQEKTARAEADSSYAAAKIMIGIAVLLAIAIIVAANMMMVRLVSRPLNRMTGIIGELAAGKLDTEIPQEDRSDEIGKLAGSITVLRGELRLADQAKHEQTDAVQNVAAGLSALAKGDLTARIEADLPGSFAKLKSDFNHAMSAVQTALEAVTASANGITGGASDIRQASDDLSRRTEQQAASLEETAAAMDEITSTVRTTAAGALTVNTAVKDARVAAEASGDIVKRAVEAMRGIEHASAEIGEIISVIDGIAFQTNLLALNAGVEAARAGDAGRGFAVVASEVRALAQRSAEAAKDVKTRITASSQQVDAGVDLVTETGQALSRIIGRIGEISTLVEEIALSAERQATGLHQVNTAVAEMDSVTQQNAAMVEEATAAARSLSNEADAMAREVRRFKLKNDDTVSPQATRPAPVRTPPPRGGTSRPRLVSGNAALAVDDWSEF